MQFTVKNQNSSITGVWQIDRKGLTTTEINDNNSQEKHHIIIENNVCHAVHVKSLRS